MAAPTQTVLSRRFDWEPTQTPYQVWQQAEGIPIHRGAYIPDLYTVEVGSWARVGQRGAFVNLAEQEHDDAYVLEVVPGGQTEVIHHFFEATVYVLQGHGATTFWRSPGGPKQTVEWQRGSMFAPPLNCYYQHYNLEGGAPARLFAVTAAPLMINLIRSADFVFSDSFEFTDRYSDDERYFSDPGRRYDPRTWQTNFVADIRGYRLTRTPSAGRTIAGWASYLAEIRWASTSANFLPARTNEGIAMGRARISSSWMAWATRCSGSTARSGNVSTGRMVPPCRRCKCSTTSISTPEPTPARYLAVTLSGLNTSGGWQEQRTSGAEGSERGGIPYDREDPDIYEEYVAECTRNGASVVMPRPQYSPNATQVVTREGPG